MQRSALTLIMNRLGHVADIGPIYSGWNSELIGSALERIHFPNLVWIRVSRSCFLRGPALDLKIRPRVRMRSTPECVPNTKSNASLCAVVCLSCLIRHLTAPQLVYIT